MRASFEPRQTNGSPAADASFGSQPTHRQQALREPAHRATGTLRADPQRPRRGSIRHFYDGQVTRKSPSSKPTATPCTGTASCGRSRSTSVTRVIENLGEVRRWEARQRRCLDVAILWPPAVVGGPLRGLVASVEGGTTSHVEMATDAVLGREVCNAEPQPDHALRGLRRKALPPLADCFKVAVNVVRGHAIIVSECRPTASAVVQGIGTFAAPITRLGSQQRLCLRRLA